MPAAPKTDYSCSIYGRISLNGQFGGCEIAQSTTSVEGLTNKDIIVDNWVANIAVLIQLQLSR